MVDRTQSHVAMIHPLAAAIAEVAGLKFHRAVPIAERVLDQLAEQLPGQSIWFRSPARASMKDRNAQILRAVASGQKPAAIAAAYGLSERRVQQIARGR